MSTRFRPEGCCSDRLRFCLFWQEMFFLRFASDAFVIRTVFLKCELTNFRWRRKTANTHVQSEIFSRSTQHDEQKVISQSTSHPDHKSYLLMISPYCYLTSLKATLSHQSLSTYVRSIQISYHHVIMFTVVILSFLWFYDIMLFSVYHGSQYRSISASLVRWNCRHD